MNGIIASGVDVGASSVKVAIVKAEEDGGACLLATYQDRIRRRDPRTVIEAVYGQALQAAGIEGAQVQYVASTGEGELVEFRRGHFYGMTTHAKGALYLCPEATAALDVGALHARAIRMDGSARVLGYRMTSQCASGSGQFLENISRYLGVALEEVGELSKQSQRPEKISGICAVLAETDVINMVSRGIRTADILKGIHDSMAGRFVKLLRTSGARGVVALTGGLAADIGLVAALEQAIAKAKLDMSLVAHPLAAYAGAVGAGLWGAFRHQKLAAKGPTDAAIAPPADAPPGRSVAPPEATKVGVAARAF